MQSANNRHRPVIHVAFRVSWLMILLARGPVGTARRLDLRILWNDRQMIVIASDRRLCPVETGPRCMPRDAPRPAIMPVPDGRVNSGRPVWASGLGVRSGRHTPKAGRARTAKKKGPRRWRELELDSVSSDSGVDAALLDRVRHAVDGEHIGRDAVVHVMRLRVPNHVI